MYSGENIYIISKTVQSYTGSYALGNLNAALPWKFMTLGL